MEKIKKINVLMCLLLAVGIRMLFPDAGFALSLFGIGAMGLYAYQMYLNKRYTKSLDETVREELNNIKSVVSGMAVKNGLKPQPKDNQKFF